MGKGWPGTRNGKTGNGHKSKQTGSCYVFTPGAEDCEDCVVVATNLFTRTDLFCHYLVAREVVAEREKKQSRRPKSNLARAHISIDKGRQ